MAKRKGISKKTRFEVFKRDSFKCRYCGRSAPDIVLELDHIHPVSKDGDESTFNYITSCEDCNRGKGDRLLSDDSVIRQQKAELDELQVRREQIEMMLEWRNSLKTLDEDVIDIAVSAADATTPGWSTNDYGRRSLAKLIRKFGLESVLRAIDTAAEQYIEIGGDGKAVEDSVHLAASKIPGICRLQDQPDWKRELYYIRGIMRNRFNYINMPDAIRFMTNAYEDGVSLEELKDIACTARNWTRWVSDIVEARERIHG